MCKFQYLAEGPFESSGERFLAVRRPIRCVDRGKRPNLRRPDRTRRKWGRLIFERCGRWLLARPPMGELPHRNWCDGRLGCAVRAAWTALTGITCRLGDRSRNRSV